MIQHDDLPELADWEAINDITTQLVDVMDSLVQSDVEHVMARRALARTIASMRAEKSFASDDPIDKQVARQLFCFRVIGAGVLV